MIDYRLYLVTARYDYPDEKFLRIIEQACRAGVTLVQLREKSATTKEIFRLAKLVKKITDKYHIPLIIDDRVEICLAVDASGVHVGDDELPVDLVRSLIGPDKILGVSAKSVARAREAQQQGADYLGVGAIFPTTTKVKTQRTSIETLQEITSSVQIPVIAIGGIKIHNTNQLSGLDIAGIAVVSEIMQADDVAGTVKQLKDH